MSKDDKHVLEGKITLQYNKVLEYFRNESGLDIERVIPNKSECSMVCLANVHTYISDTKFEAIKSYILDKDINVESCISILNRLVEEYYEKYPDKDLVFKNLVLLAKSTYERVKPTIHTINLYIKQCEEDEPVCSFRFTLEELITAKMQRWGCS